MYFVRSDSASKHFIGSASPSVNTKILMKKQNQGIFILKELTWLCYMKQGYKQNYMYDKIKKKYVKYTQMNVLREIFYRQNLSLFSRLGYFTWKTLFLNLRQKRLFFYYFGLVNYWCQEEKTYLMNNSSFNGENIYESVWDLTYLRINLLMNRHRCCWKNCFIDSQCWYQFERWHYSKWYQNAGCHNCWQIHEDSLWETMFIHFQNKFYRIRYCGSTQLTRISLEKLFTYNSLFYQTKNLLVIDYPWNNFCLFRNNSNHF